MAARIFVATSPTPTEARIEGRMVVCQGVPVPSSSSFIVSGSHEECEATLRELREIGCESVRTVWQSAPPSPPPPAPRRNGVTFTAEGGFVWNGPGPNPYAPPPSRPHRTYEVQSRMLHEYGNAGDENDEVYMKDRLAYEAKFTTADRGTLLRIAAATEKTALHMEMMTHLLQRLIMQLEGPARQPAKPDPLRAMTYGSREVPPGVDLDQHFFYALETSIRVMNCLERDGIRTLGDLLHRTPGDLLELRGFGENSLREIQAKLAALGLHLKGDTPPAG